MRGKTVAAAVMALLLVAVSWQPAAAAEDPAAVQVVETEGIAAVIDLNLALARSEAIRNALQNAVEAVAANWLLPPQYSSPDRVLWERLLDRAELHILDFRILSELSALEVYTVAVRATVSRKGVRSALQRLGLAEPEGGSESDVARVALRVFGINDYRDYVRCRDVLQSKVPGVRHLALREALWGVVRYDIDAAGSAEILGMHLRETTAFEILHQDVRLLEVYLR
jgi:hypothetical protein